MHEKLNDNFILKNAGYSNSEDTTSLGRHRWYYYKEGFSPNLVKSAIQHTGVSKSDLIIDPFNGSGTTTLTASLLGHKSLGIEVNPFTSFLSSVKTKNVKAEILIEESKKMISQCVKGANSHLVGFSTFSYRKGLKKWLFNKNILNAFEGGWGYTQKIGSHDIRKALQLILITSAMENCNAVRDGKCLRYRETWKTYGYDRDSFIESIFEKTAQVAEDLVNFPVVGETKILNGDIRKVIDTNAIRGFKLCVTSPPYLNTFDYTDIYRPELFLGKFVDDNQELYNLRLKTVRSHIQAKWDRPTKEDFGLLYTQTIKYLSSHKNRLMDKEIPTMIQAYFEDMHNILAKLHANADKDAELWLVVSNSAYAGLEVPVDLILGDIGSKTGWFLKEIGVLRYLQKRITNHSKKVKQLRESVIIFSKKKF